MRLDLYQAETARIATEQAALLTLSKQRLVDGLALSPLEQSSVLHALQVLIENAIDKAKQVLNELKKRALETDKPFKHVVNETY